MSIENYTPNYYEALWYHGISYIILKGKVTLLDLYDELFICFNNWLNSNDFNKQGINEHYIAKVILSVINTMLSDYYKQDNDDLKYLVETELGIVSNSSELQDTIIDNEHDEIPVIVFYSTENF